MRFWLCFGAIVLAAACTKNSNAATTADSVAAPATAVVIDSALPMNVLLDRFRHDVPRVDTLHGTATSRDELVRHVVAAIAASDTATLVRSAVNLAEYSWLYFPTTKVAKPPYEVPPALAWFQVQEKNRRGVMRALRELGGHRVELKSYSCDENAIVEDANRIWTSCVVTVSRDGAAPVKLRLFGAILERAGRFEVLSYDNDF